MNNTSSISPYEQVTGKPHVLFYTFATLVWSGAILSLVCMGMVGAQPAPARTAVEGDAVTATPIRCNHCNGSGWRGQFKCPVCGGDGDIAN